VTGCSSVDAAFVATVVARKMSSAAFERHGRAVVASDFIPEIGPVFAALMGEHRKTLTVSPKL